MSERTAPSIAKLDVFLPLLKALPASPDHASLVEEAEALRRAVSAFHMEAIRFRMHNVERLLKVGSATAPVTEAFEELRHALEAAGFHTRSHTAP
jgi:hypothetical protein